MENYSNRRIFLKTASLAAGICLSGISTNAASAAMEKKKTNKENKKPKYELGMASYTLREFGLDDALTMTKRVGLKKIAFKSFHLPLDSSAEKIAETLANVKKSGLELYGGGVIYMKTADEVERAFEYAKMAGMKVIIGVPNHNLLGLVEEKVKEYDIKLAIHNHGPGDKVYPTPASAY